MVTNKHLELTPFEVDVLDAPADMREALAAQADMLDAQQVVLDSLAAWLDGNRSDRRLYLQLVRAWQAYKEDYHAS